MGICSSVPRETNRRIIPRQPTDVNAASKYVHQLQERKKELNCIYSICEKQQKLELNMNSAMSDIINTIIVSWQYPEFTCAKIKYKENTVHSSNYKSTPWQQLSHKNDLTITVGYLKQMPDEVNSNEGPFLREERHLLDGICTIINDFLSMRNTRLEMKERCKELNCLYKISHLMLQNDLTINFFCNEIVNDIVPNSFQFPNQCAVQLKIKLSGGSNGNDVADQYLYYSNQNYKDHELLTSMKTPVPLPQSLSTTPAPSSNGGNRKTLKNHNESDNDKTGRWRVTVVNNKMEELVKSPKRRGSSEFKRSRRKSTETIYIGSLEVGYVVGATQDVMFLLEEQQLLHAISNQVGSCVSKFTRDQLVHSMLPPRIALELQLHNKVKPQVYEMISILFTDIVGFTIISSECSPDEICNMLDRLYKRFDEIVIGSNKLLYKIETIGDAYMVVSGLPDGNIPPDATAAMTIFCGLAFIEAAKGIYAIAKDGKKINIEIRAGVHSGMVVAGVVGKLMPRYCLFGDTVNTASRMESNGVKNRVHISKSTMELAKPIIENMKHYVIDKNNTKLLSSSQVIMNASPKTYDSSATNIFAYELLQHATITERGKIPIKGKGEMETYFIDRGTELPSIGN
eukprot:g6485.t1